MEPWLEFIRGVFGSQCACDRCACACDQCACVHVTVWRPHTGLKLSGCGHWERLVSSQAQSRCYDLYLHVHVHVINGNRVTCGGGQRLDLPANRSVWVLLMWCSQGKQHEITGISQQSCGRNTYWQAIVTPHVTPFAASVLCIHVQVIAPCACAARPCVGSGPVGPVWARPTFRAWWVW